MPTRGGRWERSKQERAERMAALDRLGRGIENVVDHFGQTGRAFRGECPVCQHSVKARQYERQTVTCSCGHTVTQEQWQEYN